MAVRQFEADYMAQHGGNKPTGADKDPIRPLLKEYFTIKRQLESSSEMLSKTAPAKLMTTKGDLKDVYCAVGVVVCLDTLLDSETQ